MTPRGPGPRRPSGRGGPPRGGDRAPRAPRPVERPRTEDRGGRDERPRFEARPRFEDRGRRDERPSFEDRPRFEDRVWRREEPREDARDAEASEDEGGKGGRAVYGIHAVAEAIETKADAIEHLYVLEGRAASRVQALIDKAREKGVALRFVDRERLRLLAGTVDHQGLVARLAAYAYSRLEDLVGVATAAGEPMLIVALDGVQDPRNLGAVLRSAEALGAHGVVIPRERAAGITPIAAKVAAGAAERIPVARETNLVRALEALKKAGAWVVGAEAGAETPAAKYDFRGPTVIVVGGEEKGLRPLVARACDAKIGIPLAGATASLNASIAAAILLYEARRQRG